MPGEPATESHCFYVSADMVRPANDDDFADAMVRTDDDETTEPDDDKLQPQQPQQKPDQPPTHCEKVRATARRFGWNASVAVFAL